MTSVQRLPTVRVETAGDNSRPSSVGCEWRLPVQVLMANWLWEWSTSACASGRGALLDIPSIASRRRIVTRTRLPKITRSSVCGQCQGKRALELKSRLLSGRLDPMPYDRFLASEPAAEHFLGVCLGLRGGVPVKTGDTLSISQVIKHIRDAEILSERGSAENTFDSENQRSSGYRTKTQRDTLRKQVLEELMNLERVDDDDAICLGTGGAKPKGVLRQDQKRAYLLTGLPASGKSTVVSKIADHFGAFVIDPDYAKRKLPEFDNTVMGAALVHTESSAITLGKDYSGPNLLQFCVYAGYNIVRPLVGERRKKVDDFRDFLLSHGYEVHLSVVDLDRELAVKRALTRFLDSSRYVPLSYIFDDCANEPSLVYYKYRAEACDTHQSPWASLGSISTERAAPARVDSWGKGNPAELFV